MSSETELMLKVKAGQVNYLAPLFERNKAKLFNFFRRMGNSPTVSEDLVQDTFMRILAYRTSFGGEHGFTCWMYGIARNTSAEYYRKNKNNLDHLEIEEDSIPVDLTLTDEMSHEQQQALFRKSLASIKAEHREILVLSRFQQLKYEEIAQLLDCNLNTLKTRIRAAINAVQLRYQELSGEVK